MGRIMTTEPAVITRDSSIFVPLIGLRQIYSSWLSVIGEEKLLKLQPQLGLK